MSERGHQERYFYLIYNALRPTEHIRTDAAAAGIAAMRLLLIDAVGEQRQRELIAKWNKMRNF